MYYVFGKPLNTLKLMRIAIFYHENIAKRYLDLLYKDLAGEWELHCLHQADPELPELQDIWEMKI